MSVGGDGRDIPSLNFIKDTPEQLFADVLTRGRTGTAL
jgi:hypothetical protein